MKKTVIFSAHEISVILMEEAIRRLRWRGPLVTQTSDWHTSSDAYSNTITVTLSDE